MIIQLKRISQSPLFKTAGFFSLKKYPIQKLLMKSVSLLLVFTFLYSQLVWAVDPRQMLLLAKKSFELEDQYRIGGSSASEVELTQEQKQALVDEKNELASLSQKQQFSLTTENGDILRYVDGKLRRIDRPDGTSLKNIKLGADGAIQSADIKLQDGSLQIYDNGKVLGYRLPNGGQALYEAGVLTRVISKQGQETTYTYIKDAKGNVTEIILENSDSKAWYTPEGKIKQSYSKKDSATFNYDNGILKSIQKQDGSTLVFIEEVLGTNKKIFLVEQQDPLNPFQYALYREDNSLKEIRDKDSRKIESDEQGFLTKVTDANGKEVQFDFTESSLSTIVNSRIKQDNGVNSTYDADGRLSAVRVGELTIHYKEDEDKVDFIEKTDGTEIHNLVFDAQGNLKDALFITPDGEERTYKNGKLDSIKKPDLTQVFYFDDKPTKLITSQKLAYNFNYTPDLIEAKLDSSIVPDATTPIKMNYATDFSLKKLIRQNKEVLSYLNNDLMQIDYPEDKPQVFTYTKDDKGKLLSYKVTQGDVETFYDNQHQVIKALVHKSLENAHDLEITYQYGKIRQIKKDNVLTFKYTYTFNDKNEEFTQIEDLEEKTFKVYKNSLLLTNLNQETSVLSTYSYYEPVIASPPQAGEAISPLVKGVQVTRFGRTLHTYVYSYKDDQTIVQDEEGVIRTYDKNKKLLFLEKNKEKFAYSYAKNSDNEEIVTQILIERTLPGNAKAFYEQGAIKEVVLSDGSKIIEFKRKDDLSFDKATLLLKDGTKLVFNQTEVLEEILTDNTHFYFENTKLKKAVTPLGAEYLYSYDATNNKTYLDYKNLILHYDPQDNLLGTKVKDIQAMIEGTHDFLDEVVPSRTITSSGGVALTSGSPKFGRGALSMPGGQSDYLKVPASTDFDFGTGDFTIEFFANFSQVSNCVLFDRDGGRAGYTFELYNGRLYWTDNNTGNKKNESWSPSANTWYHLAITRQNSQLHFYANGQELGSGAAHTTNLTYAPTDLYIGTSTSGNLAFNGRLDEVRVSKGVARYTSNFTPTTQAFQIDSQTKLLLHFDGLDNSYLSYKDSALLNQRSTFAFDSQGKLSSSSFNASPEDLKSIWDNSSLTQQASIKNQAILDPNNKRIGNASLALDGQDDAVIVKNNPSFNFKKEDFTVEFFLKFDEIKTSFFFSRWANLMDMVYGTNGNLYFILGGQDVKVQSFSPQLSAWYHLAVERDKGQMRLFLDGKELGTPTPNDTNIDYVEDLWLGLRANMALGFHGHLDELRISKGIARYTQDFTPQTQEFSADPNTALLLHFDNEQQKAFDKTKEAIGAIPSTFIKSPLLPYKDKKQRQDKDFPTWLSLSKDSLPEAQEVMSQEYSSGGDLETQTKADGTVTLFENNKPSKILGKDGTVLVEYSYDGDGRPKKVFLKNARDVLPKEVLKAKEQIEGQRSNTLLELAKQKNLAYQTIQDQVKDQKKALQDQLVSLGGQYNSVSSVSVKGKKAKSQKGDALNQIGGAMDQVRGALASLESQEADAYAKLDSQVKTLSDKIEADSQKAFQEVAAQEAKLKKEILKQEVSPIVYDYYRRILGRDPDSNEYQNWVDKIDYDSGKAITGYEPKEITTQVTKQSASLRFDGDHDYLSSPDSPDWNLGTGDFTWDFWIRFDQVGIGSQVIFDRGDATPYALFHNSAGNFGLQFNGAVVKTEAGGISANTWYHIAVVRSGTNLMIFKDGTQLGSPTTNSSNLSGTAGIAIGAQQTGGAAGFKGYIDNFRFSKGVARWTANFTPTSNQYTPDNATKLLLAHKNNATSFKDTSASNHSLTAQGNIVLDATQSKTQYQETQIITIQVPVLKEVTQALRDYLESLVELKDRAAYVTAVKKAVTDKINEYLAASLRQRQLIAASLGLSPDEVIDLTNSDAQRVLAWLNSRGLHFGQSAFLSLESLLDQKGISYAREDIAWKAILIDILTGVITPLDDGDLVLSVYSLNKVASLYRLTLSGANLTWEDLQALYNPSPPGDGMPRDPPRIIANINTNHYVVITGITSDSITYIDPGIGKDKENESLTVTKQGFLKTWKGYVTLEDQKLEALSGYQNKILSASQAQKIRGAFWGSILNLVATIVWIINPALGTLINILRVAALATSIAEGDWFSAVAATVSIAFSDLGTSLAHTFQGAFQGVTQALGPVGQILNGIGQVISGVGQMVSGIYQSVTGFFGNISDGLAGFLRTFHIASDIATRIAETAVSVGLNFGFSRGLETLGVNPRIAGFMGSLAAGAITGGMKGATKEIIDGKTVFITQAQHIQSSIQQIITLSEVGRLGLRLGLDSSFTSIISLSIAAIQGQFIDKTVSSLSKAFSNIKPQLFSSLAQWGMGKLGSSIGLNSLASTLISMPIAVVLNQGLETGFKTGTDIIDAVNRGFSAGIVKYGLDFVGTTHPILGSLLSRDVTRNIGLALGRENLFPRMTNILRRAAINIFNVTQGVVQKVFEGTSSFGSLIQQKGIVGAFESFVTSAFSRSAQEVILQKGGVQGLFDSTPKTPITLPDGRSALELKIDGEDSLFFDDVSRLIGRKDEGIYQLGEFGYDSFGKFALLEGNVYSGMENDLNLQAGVRDGQLISIKIDGPQQDTVLQIDPEKNKKTIFIEGPKPDQPSPDQSFNFWGNAFNLMGQGLKLFMREGVAHAAELASIPVAQAARDSSVSRILYALVNGIGNAESDPNVPPDYIRNLKDDLGTSSQGQVNTNADIMPSAIYQGQGIPILDNAKDLYLWLKEVQSSIKRFIATQKIEKDFDGHFVIYPQDKARPIVAMGYSAGFVPLVEAIKEKKYNAETIVGLGAVTTLIGGLSPEYTNQILAWLEAGAFGLAKDLIQKVSSGIPSLAGTSVKRIVNVWGTNDIGTWFGASGPRYLLAGVGTINIEIQGATHFDYMRRSANDPNPPDARNIKVSEFVTDLMLKANDELKLNKFLSDSKAIPGQDGVWRVQL